MSDETKAIAGEKLQPGDEVEIGEDGKVYRVHPHGWMRWTCRRPKDGDVVRILGADEQWRVKGDTVQSLAGAVLRVTDETRWKHNRSSAVMHSVCLSSVLPSAAAVASILYHGDGGTFTRAEIEAAHPKPDPDPNPWLRLGSNAPGVRQVEIKGIAGHGLVKYVRDGWAFVTHGCQRFPLTDDAEWRYAHP